MKISKLCAAIVVSCVLVSALARSTSAQTRQTVVSIDDGTGKLLNLVVGSITGASQTLTFPGLSGSGTAVVSTGVVATGSILYKTSGGTYTPVGGTPGVLLGGTTPTFGPVDLTSNLDVSGQLPVGNGGTGTNSLSNLATNLKPYATNILPANAAGALTNDGGGNLSWQAALTDPMTTEGDMMYQHLGSTSRLAVGSNTYILASTGTDPAWTDPSTITVGTATNALKVNGNTIPANAAGVLTNDGAGNLSWGSVLTNPMTATGDIIYSSSNTGTPARLGLGTSGYIMTAGASAPQYTNPSTITVGTATNALKVNGNTIPANAAGVLTNDGSGNLTWGSAGSGTVTSVALTTPSFLSVAGSPVTTSGTLAVSLASESANTVLASPDGSAGTPSFRALVANDIPNLDASKITTGTLSAARGGTGNSNLTFPNVTGTVAVQTGSSGYILNTQGLALSGSDVTNNTTTLANTGLSFSVGANETWTFECMLLVNGGNSTAKAGIEVGVTGTNSPTIKVATYGTGASGAGSFTSARLASSGIATAAGFCGANQAGNDGFIIIYGTIKAGASASTVNIQFCASQSSSTPTVTVQTGSYVNARKM